MPPCCLLPPQLLHTITTTPEAVLWAIPLSLILGVWVWYWVDNCRRYGPWPGRR